MGTERETTSAVTAGPELPAGESGRRKRLRPATTAAKLEWKLDMLLEQQAATQEQHAKHMEDMQAMLDKHHRDRMSAMKRLIKTS